MKLLNIKRYISSFVNISTHKITSFLFTFKYNNDIFRYKKLYLGRVGYATWGHSIYNLPENNKNNRNHYIILHYWIYVAK